MDGSNKVTLIKESDGNRTHNTYKLYCEKDEICFKQVTKTKQWDTLNSLFTNVFLPHGYPHSVSKDYLRYQMWDSIQAFASGITGSVCTHAVLKGAGVGDESASPLAATITWLVKDGTSMIGRITFAWLQGTKLDYECKKWRLFADIMNDLSMFLDLLSAYFQDHFTLIICLSGLIKSLVSVAGGSTRAALTQHQARKNNMADVSAKDGSQETLVNLFALICSLILIPVVTKSFVYHCCFTTTNILNSPSPPSSPVATQTHQPSTRTFVRSPYNLRQRDANGFAIYPRLTWMMYILMTILHLTANYFAVKSVEMETFNSARFKIFARHYFFEGRDSQNIFSVKEVNRKESVFFSVTSEKFAIKIGSSFTNFIEDKSSKEIQSILQLYKDLNYMLACTVKKNASKVIIKVILSRKATVLTEIEAMYQACFLEHILKNGNENLFLNGDRLLHALTLSRDYTRKNFSNFLMNVSEKGFNVQTTYFDTDKWRVEW